MPNDLILIPPRDIGKAGFHTLPVTISRVGENASRRFIEFFMANIRN
jgi:hypothetical protein